MKTTKRFLSIAVAGLIFTSCQKNSSGPSAVDFQLRATNTVAGVQRSAAPSIQWTAGTATPTSVKFEAKKAGTEVEFTTSGGQQVNLFTQTQNNFGNITLPDGTYSEIELKFQLNGTTAAPALELNGTYDNGTMSIPVIFRVTTPLQLKAEKENVTVTGGSFTAVTALSLSSFTAGVTQTMLNNATLTNGSVVISSASNTSLYNIILANISQFHHAEFEHH